MSCDESRLVAFLNGDLSDTEEQAFDEHLLTCEECWRAVRDDRMARHALDALRGPAPTGLADRLTSAVRLAPDRPDIGPRPARNRRSRRPTGNGSARPGQHRPARGRRLALAIAAAAALLVVTAGTVAGLTLGRHRATDPPQITRVVAMMSPKVAGAPALAAGEHFDFGGQALEVRSYRIEGQAVLVATSTRAFPMPAHAHMLAGSSSRAWMAAEGRLALYGVNQTATGPGRSMFLVAAMPMAELPQVAARLHLI